MTESAAEAFRAWHDFYMLLGTAAATLIGAMFVVASIGSSLLTRSHAPQIRIFLTPTVIHLSSVVLAAVVAMMPAVDWLALNILFGVGGIGGIVYSFLIGLRIVKSRNIDWEDRVWYALLPLVGYGIILAAALSILLRAVPDLLAIAVGLVLLVVAGIRNAWDMIIFFASQDNDLG